MTDYTVNYNLKKYNDRNILFKEMAEELKQKVNKRRATISEFFLAISGGSTPVPLFVLLSREYWDLPWGLVHIFWVDERMVPPEDHESNYGIAKRVWLDKVEIPPANIHFINGANSPEEEVKKYSEKIKSIVPSVNGLPSFDWIWLGIGEDGHTASLFPGVELECSDDIAGVSEHPVTGQKRITLTEKTINNSKEATFIITGKGKENILDEIINRKNHSLPAAKIELTNGDLNFLIAP